MDTLLNFGLKDQHRVVVTEAVNATAQKSSNEC